MVKGTPTWDVVQFEDNDLFDAVLPSLNLLGIDMDRLASEILKRATPVGTIIAGGWTSAPEGFLLCQGQAISRAEYTELFKRIGPRYGSGNGSTTFEIPDMRGNVAVGLKDDAGVFSNLGKTGGERDHTLTIEEVPAHTHALDPSGRFIGDGNGSESAGVATSGTGYKLKNGLANSGGGKSHNNLQPYLVVNFAIKF